MSSNPDLTCPGCNKFFNLHRNLESHLAQSRDPLCRAAYEERLKAHQHDSQPSGPSASPEVVAFAGDALGTAKEYANDTFGQDVGDFPMGGDSASEMEVSEAEADGDDEAELDTAELEQMWEPLREGAPAEGLPGDAVTAEDELAAAEERDDEEEVATRRNIERVIVGEGLGAKPVFKVQYTEKHPSSKAGQPLAQEKSTDEHYQASLESGKNEWAPFNSKLDWEIAKWAKLRGAGSTAFSDLLKIEEVRERLNLSYRNSDDLNKIIDDRLPGQPQFRRHEVIQSGEVLEFFSRDIIECLRALWGDADFVFDLIFQPERHYTDEGCNIRLYHDMHTGKWWWKTQKKVQTSTRRKNITIVPIIISSDKTQLTTFRGKTAYPVYMTIGNLPKQIRRKPSRQGQVLIAYLPTSKLDHITNKSSRRRCMSNLFHHCMRYIFKPLERIGREGIILVSGDGAARRCYPILAAYVGDYPEQVLVGLVRNGECPVCPALRDEIGNWDSILGPRDTQRVISALHTIDQGAAEFMKACAREGIKPVQGVFWRDLPFIDIYQSITPDILHQLFQGLLKHLIAWIRAVCGDAEIDARCRRLPPNHHIRLFLKGISHLSRVTGTEHDQISRFLLALVADIRLPEGHSNAKLVRAVRAVLDFIYLARYPIHTTETLAEMDDALWRFHVNHDIFISLGIRTHFNIPKLHYIGHYHEFIELYGTPDNFNTEYTERLHIDLAKDAYAATNYKDEFPQMTAWLERKERVIQHEKFIRRRQDTSANTPLGIVKPLPCLIPERRQRMAKHPTHKAIPLDVISRSYGASSFVDALSRFVVQYQHPDFSKSAVQAAADSVHIPFNKLPVFHRIKFVSYDVYSLTPLDEEVVDSVHVDPAHVNKYGKVVPGRFDTVLVNVKASNSPELKDLCVGQVRCIFTLPPAAVRLWFPHGFPHKHLAYVEWFTPFSRAPIDNNTKLFRISRLVSQGERRASIVPVSLILGSVHLFPKFGPQAPVSWTSSNVLDQASSFYVNVFSDRFLYSTIY